jgi:hypothetical protein
MHTTLSRFKVTLVLLVLCIPLGKLQAQDSAKYLDKTWRDSVLNYQGRLQSYQQELYSYDLGMTLGMLPIVGETNVGKEGTGIAYFAARTVAVAVGVVGAVRLIEGKPSIGLDIGMLVGGIAGWVGLEFSELADIRHTVSERNEDLVEKWQIPTPDIEPHSIRYPTKNWPTWVTSTPEQRHYQNAREAVDKPLPKVTGNEQ